MPFVQGHLWKQSIAVTITTACEHCARPMQLEFDSELRYRVTDGAEPLIAVPLVDFERLKDPSIIHAF
jgi:hypothetical protein